MFTSNVSHFQYLFTTIASRNLIYFVLIGIECDENGMLVKSTHDVQTINQLNCLMLFELKNILTFHSFQTYFLCQINQLCLKYMIIIYLFDRKNNIPYNQCNISLINL